LLLLDNTEPNARQFLQTRRKMKIRSKSRMRMMMKRRRRRRKKSGSSECTLNYWSDKRGEL